jgi:hypothetical protein
MLRFTMLFALIGCVGVAGCKSFDEQKSKADALARELLSSIADGQTEKIDAMMTDECRASASPEKLAKLVGMFQRKLGKFRSLQQVSWHVMAGTGGTTGKFEYTVVWEKGGGTLTLGTVTKDGVMKMQAFNITSDALLDDGPTTASSPAKAP